MYHKELPEEFGIEDVKDCLSQEKTYAGEPEGFNIREAGSDPARRKQIDAEIVTVWDWLQVSKEKTRKHIVYVFLGLLILWIIAGFAAFFIQRDISLLASAPLLTNPVAFMMGYYFGAEQSKRGKE